MHYGWHDGEGLERCLQDVIIGGRWLRREFWLSVLHPHIFTISVRLG